MKRRDKENYYLDIAATVLERGTCLRRNYGAVIVKNDVIVSTGYNGAPRGRANCCTVGFCMRDKLGIPSGERYELCRSVHAEANAIIAASRNDMLGATMYIAGKDMKTGEFLNDTNSCYMCRRLIINSGISKIVLRREQDKYEVVDVRDWIYKEDEIAQYQAESVATANEKNS